MQITQGKSNYQPKQMLNRFRLRKRQVMICRHTQLRKRNRSTSLLRSGSGIDQKLTKEWIGHLTMNRGARCRGENTLTLSRGCRRMPPRAAASAAAVITLRRMENSRTTESGLESWSLAVYGRARGRETGAQAIDV
jgi:hypothetical protein